MSKQNSNQPFVNINEALAALKTLRSDAANVAGRLTVAFIKSLKRSELESLIKAAPRKWRVWIKHADRFGSPTDTRSGKTLYNEFLNERAAKRKIAQSNAGAAKPTDAIAATNTTINTPNDTATNTPTSTPRDLIAEISTMANQEMASVLMSIAYADNIEQVMALLTTHALQKLSSAISGEVHRRAKMRRDATKARREARAAKAKEAKDKPADEFPAPKPDTTPDNS